MTCTGWQPHLHITVEKCVVQLCHLLHLETKVKDMREPYPARDRDLVTVQSFLRDPAQAREYFKGFSNLLDHEAMKGLPDFSTPWLAAHSCSVLSLIVATSRAVQEEVDGKVANLPAMELHKGVGSARLALIGITDWHRQLSRVSRHCSTMRTGLGEPSDVAGGQHSRALDDACAAMVMGMDRLILHARSMGYVSLYRHERSAPAIVEPHGPLSEAEGTKVKHLLQFFKDVPRKMYEDAWAACYLQPHEESAKMEVWFLRCGSDQRQENE